MVASLFLNTNLKMMAPVDFRINKVLDIVSMNINERLLELTGNLNPSLHDYLSEYSCHRKDIKDFLLTKRAFLDRQSKAKEIINKVITHHGKAHLLEHVTDLAKIEHGIQELAPCLRDHVVHAVLGFILGIYLNESWMSEKASRFQWKLSGLLHDVAYPAEIAHDILDSMPKTLNGIAADLGFSARRVRGVTQIEGLENLHHGFNSLDLIQDRINEWGLRFGVRDEYERMLREGRPCHGMYSSLSLLWVLDMMYEKNNPDRLHEDIPAEQPYLSWNQRYFEQDIVSACTAIFLHNLPVHCFRAAKIDRKRAPLAFLLKLTDSLQEWERPSKQNPDGWMATNFDINDNSDILTMMAKIPEDRKEKIRAEIRDILIAPDILVV